MHEDKSLAPQFKYKRYMKDWHENLLHRDRILRLLILLDVINTKKLKKVVTNFPITHMEKL